MHLSYFLNVVGLLNIGHYVNRASIFSDEKGK